MVVFCLGQRSHVQLSLIACYDLIALSAKVALLQVNITLGTKHMLYYLLLLPLYSTCLALIEWNGQKHKSKNKNTSFSTPFAPPTTTRCKTTTYEASLPSQSLLFPFSIALPPLRSPSTVCHNTSWKCQKSPQSEPQLVTATGPSRQGRGCRGGSSPSWGGRAAFWPQSWWCPSDPQTCAALRSCCPGQSNQTENSRFIFMGLLSLRCLSQRTVTGDSRQMHDEWGVEWRAETIFCNLKQIS